MATTTPTLDRIIKLTKELVGHEYLYFGTAATFFDFSVWAVCVSPTDVLYVMDSEQEWYEVGEKHEPFLSAVLQRVEAAMIFVGNRQN